MTHAKTINQMSLLTSYVMEEHDFQVRRSAAEKIMELRDTIPDVDYYALDAAPRLNVDNFVMHAEVFLMVAEKMPFTS